jgi:hypothetical protein
MDATPSTDQVIAGFESLVKFANLVGMVALYKAFVESQKLAKEEDLEKLAKKEDLAALASEMVAVHTEQLLANRRDGHPLQNLQQTQSIRN